MEAHKLQLKFYLQPSSKPELDTFVPVLHGVIREKKLGSEVLIDVADYSHVHEGPGIVLIGHEADYFIDAGEGRLGLLYNKKRGSAASLEASVKDAFSCALRMCAVLESSFQAAPLSFATDEALLRINDRLLATNTRAQFDELRPALEGATRSVYGSGVELMQEGTPRELFTVRIKAAGAPRAADLHARLDA
ncbi:MAG TPA: hypothetical protein VK524_08585 [Polyangiaceae bacterium]|nr:hypothetical protein [Polyangiaceae bacterium]